MIFSEEQEQNKIHASHGKNHAATWTISAGLVEGESSLFSTVGNASSAMLHYYILVSAEHPCASENSNSKPGRLLQAKSPQGIKKLTWISQ